MRMRIWMTAVACCLLALAGQPASAQSYPARVVRIVVPFPPGGPTDVAARLIAQPLGETLGQSVIVENQTGGGGRTGSRSVARAAPDGYTLLMGGTNLNAIIPAIYQNLDYDPVKSFTAVASVASDAVVMVVNPSVPARTVAELVQDAKAHPGQLKYGSAPGIASHLASELLKYRAGIDMPFIPYRGGGPAITDLLGGQIDMIFNNKSVLLALIQGEKLRALAVTADERWPELPDVPTMREAGFPDFPSDIVYGLLAPAGTPDAIRREAQRGGQQGAAIGGAACQPGEARHRGAAWDASGIRRRDGGRHGEIRRDRPADPHQGRVKRGTERARADRPTRPRPAADSAPGPAG